MGKCICDICGKEGHRIINGKRYCDKHRRQIKSHGALIERTIYDKNEILLRDNYAEIKLYNKNGLVIGSVLISLDKVEMASKYKWGIGSSKYFNIQTTIDGEKVLLWRFLTNAPSNFVVDHINGNRFDNRNENLRIATKQQNTCNHTIYKNNTTGYPGISFNKRQNKWVAYIKFNYQRINLGTFDDFLDAVRARETTEKELFGAYRRTIKGV